MARLSAIERAVRISEGRALVADLSSKGNSANAIVSILRGEGKAYSSRQSILADVRAAKGIAIKPDTSAQSRGGHISGEKRGAKSKSEAVRARADKANWDRISKESEGINVRRDNGGGGSSDSEYWGVITGVALTDIEQGETGEFIVGGG